MCSQVVLVGEPASLNSVKMSSDTRHRAITTSALSKAWIVRSFDAILHRSVVRYPNALRDGSTIDADFRASRAVNRVLYIRRMTQLWIRKVDRRSQHVLLSEEADGYVDPIMTGWRQPGCPVTLVSGAQGES